LNAGFPNSGFRKFLPRRLQLLKTRNVRSDEVVDAHVFYDDNRRSRGFGAVRMSKAGFRAATEARAYATDGPTMKAHIPEGNEQLWARGEDVGVARRTPPLGQVGLLLTAPRLRRAPHGQASLGG
jgi:hypothetical protein